MTKYKDIRTFVYIWDRDNDGDLVSLEHKDWWEDLPVDNIADYYAPMLNKGWSVTVKREAMTTRGM